MTDEQLQRIHDIEYSCDSREELAERIVGLEDKLAMYENDHQIATNIHGSWKRLKAEVPKLRDENAKLRACLGDGCADCAAGMGKYADSICDQIKAENDKLREELAQWERLTAGIELPEYPITQFEPKDLERENAKLRELVRDALRPKYDHTLLMTPVEWREYDDDVLRRARELGVEVDG